MLNLILNRLQYILSDKFLSSETSSEREKYKIEVDSNKWLDSVTATIHYTIQDKSSQTKMFQFYAFLTYQHKIKVFKQCFRLGYSQNLTRFGAGR